ncbi:hypothetical protein Tco_0438532 [Tanacetum coccineum]
MITDGCCPSTENLDYEFLSAGNKDDEASDQIAFKQLTLEQAIPLDRICPSQVLKGVNEFTQKLTSVLDKVETDITQKDEKRSQNGKPNMEWKSRKKTKSSQTKSLKKSTKVNPSQPRSQKSRKISLRVKFVKTLNLFKEENKRKEEKGGICQCGKVKLQGPKLPKP